MAEKRAILRGLIDGTIYELLPKTDVYSVKVDENTSLAAKLSEMVQALNGKVTPEQMEEAIELALANGGGGGSGGAQPDWDAAEGEPGHILNRTHEWVEYSDEVALDDLVVTDMGLSYYGEPIRLIGGEEYEVRLSGSSTVYKCVAVEMYEDGYRNCVLGNIGALTGEGDTGEPFLILASDGYEAMGGIYSAVVIPLTEDIPSRVRIQGKHYRRKKIDRAWLPIPGIASIEFTVTVKSNGAATVSCDHNCSEIADLIRAGYVINARATISVAGTSNAAKTSWLTLLDMDDVHIRFTNINIGPSGDITVFNIAALMDDSGFAFSEYKKLAGTA